MRASCSSVISTSVSVEESVLSVAMLVASTVKISGSDSIMMVADFKYSLKSSETLL